MRIVAWIGLVCLFLPETTAARETFENDTFVTSGGDLIVTFIGHGSLMFRFDRKTIHVDPVMREAGYSRMPKADLVVITHDHPDHLDPKAVKAISKKGTQIVMSSLCHQKIKTGIVMNNGDEKTISGLPIRAVPAYNIVHKRKDGNPYHPKGAGNGYLITFGDKTVYIAGDTENVPEMKALQGVDIAFLPMNLPFTMTPEMVADAARAFKPKILYPYHYGKTDPAELEKLLKGLPDVQVRIRDMK